MKKFLFPVLLIALAISTAFAQVPASFNYQAVVRNSSGEIISNKTVSFRISLLEDSESGTVVYSETHTLSTNDFGLVNLKIGKGTKISGDFSPASWGDIIFTKIEIDPAGGDSFSELATTKLSSVPYAFKAQTVVNDKVDDADHNATNELQTLSLSGNNLTLSNSGGTVTLPSGGGSLWTESGGNVYRLSGKVGIGTSNPSYLMDIGGSSATLGLKASYANAIIYLDRKSSNKYAYILYRTNGINNFYAGILGDNNYKINYGGTSGLKGLEVKTTGDVVMSDKLDVTGKLSADEIFCNSNLDVADEITVGSLSLSGSEIHTTNTGDANLMPFAYGQISSAAAKNGCTSNVGVVTRVLEGQYTVSINGLGTDYSVIVTPNQGAAYLTGVVTGRYSTYFVVAIWDTKNDKYSDGGFSFVVYKP